jgi:REP element-mobilizing transposase RayT
LGGFVPRKPRILIEGAVYHVYNRVASGEPVLADPDEAARFVDLLRQVKLRDGWTVFAWCVMSNHYHLALRTSAVPLSRGLHHLQCTFSRGFNRRSGRTGSLWQSRYQAKLVDKQGYLSQVVLYIHLNPVRSGAVEDPASHLLSGHREIIGKVAAPLVDVDDALLCFDVTARSARRTYLSAVRAGCEGLGRSRASAAPPFRALLWRDHELEPKAGEDYVDVLGRSTGLERPSMPARQFIEELCRLLGAAPESLASRSRDRSTAEARRIVATLGVERWGQKGRELGRVLGKNSDMVSAWVGEGVRRRLADVGFARRLDDLDRALAEAAAHGWGPGDRS